MAKFKVGDVIRDNQAVEFTVVAIDLVLNNYALEYSSVAGPHRIASSINYTDVVFNLHHSPPASPAVPPYTVGTMLKQRAGTHLYEVTAANPDKDDYTLYNHSAGHSYPGITEKDLNTWFVIDTKSVHPTAAAQTQPQMTAGTFPHKFLIGELIKSKQRPDIYVVELYPDPETYRLRNPSTGYILDNTRTYIEAVYELVQAPAPQLTVAKGIIYPGVPVGMEHPWTMSSGTKTCQHVFVEVGFMHTKMVCKHCDMEQPKQ